MSADFNQLREIFLAAVEQHPPERWDAYLDAACGGDDLLRRAVARLLKAHGDGATPVSDPTRVGEAPGEGAGGVIGAYRLVEPIGEGGMGTVWLAQQTRPVRRTVALKLIKAGLDTKAVLARFEAERQALALMDHPNIAKVLDAGTTEAGRPYLVMELVQGVPITRYCDEQRLTPRQRVELFVPVCQAVQHAHQKGVIHRDLKPSNVLVAVYDGVPVPKVIDFGVAKAAGVELTDKSLATGYGAVVGTLEYMSPEQAELNHLDLDTRADVYSLGVLLYELLTGTTPLDRQRLKAASLLEALRLIREEEAPPPSRRCGSAFHELDWIVLKALEKDRDRRYETAAGLGQDLARYLNEEPVQACPPSAAYRLRKYARRHRAAVAVAGVVVTALLVAVVGLAASTALVWRALEREQRSSYWQTIALAEREWSANNLAHVQGLLARCPERYRGWEWHCLTRLPGKSLPSMRHDHPVNCVAVTADGRRFVSADNVGFVKVWDATTGGCLHAVRGHDQTVIGLACDPRGELFATTDADFSGTRKGVVKVWDARTGKPVSSWVSQHSLVSSPVFRADGLLAVTARDEAGPAVVVTLDPTTGAEAARFGKATPLVWHLPTTRDGRQLAVSVDGDVMTVWDVQADVAVCTLAGGTGRGLRCSALSPDGRLVAVGYGEDEERGSSKVLVWEVRTGRKRHELVGQAVLSLAFHPDGSRLASGGMDDTVKLWDVASGHEILTLRRQFDWISGLAFTPDGHRLVCSGGKDMILVWDATPVREGEKIGQELFTLGGHANSVTAVAFHPTLPRLATGSEGGVRTWDTRTGAELRPFPVPLTRTSAVAYSPDGKRLAFAGKPPTVVQILDAETGAALLEISAKGRGDWVMRVAFSPDGTTLAVAANDGAVFLHDAATGRLLGRLPGHHRAVTDVAFHPDPGRALLASTDSSNGRVRVWDTVTRGELSDTKLTHQAATWCVAFSPDGRLLATGGADRAICLWDTQTWKEVDRWRDPTGGVSSVAFSPTEGRLLAWGSMDSTVKVWNRRSGEVATLRGHGDAVLSVAFSGDGTRLASGSVDGTARVWETPPLP